MSEIEHLQNAVASLEARTTTLEEQVFTLVHSLQVHSDKMKDIANHLTLLEKAWE